MGGALMSTGPNEGAGSEGDSVYANEGQGMLMRGPVDVNEAQGVLIKGLLPVNEMQGVLIKGFMHANEAWGGS